jgi:hypothetical protein
MSALLEKVNPLFGSINGIHWFVVSDFTWIVGLSAWPRAGMPSLVSIVRTISIHSGGTSAKVRGGLFVMKILVCTRAPFLRR